MGTQRSEDFRDWDIEVGINYSGFDQLGFPFCIWREKADSRLSLSRPRYCCVTLKDAKLYFNFFNPSEDVRSTGTTAVFGIAAGLMAIATVWDGWRVRQERAGIGLYSRYEPAALYDPGRSLFVRHVCGNGCVVACGMLR